MEYKLSISTSAVADHIVGKVARYSFFDRLMILLIMWITKGPTDPNAVVEFTDWHQVEAFGRLICKM